MNSAFTTTTGFLLPILTTIVKWANASSSDLHIDMGTVSTHKCKLILDLLKGLILPVGDVMKPFFRLWFLVTCYYDVPRLVPS